MMTPERVRGSPVSPGGVAEVRCRTDRTDRELLQDFVRDKDGDAFEALVRRYGELVFGVCRRTLGGVHDAEDAFQATFVVLARKAHAIANPDLLGNWLYGVAQRVARKARAQTVQRWQTEALASSCVEVTPDPLRGMTCQEARLLLSKHLQQLPDRYRTALELCYLEGMTNLEAAQRLGWRPGSISYRLARARQMLRERLLPLE